MMVTAFGSKHLYSVLAKKKKILCCSEIRLETKYRHVMLNDSLA